MTSHGSYGVSSSTVYSILCSDLPKKKQLKALCLCPFAICCNACYGAVVICCRFICFAWTHLPLDKMAAISLTIFSDAFLACSRACASKVFSLRADCGRVIVYPGLKQWERPRHNIFGVCTRLAGGVCMSTSANSSASKHLTVTKIVWKIVYVTFDYLISHFFKILSLEFMANLFRDFRASVSLKVFHYRLRGKWCQYDLEIN